MSSSGPATLAGSECPEPPVDFSQRELPICELNLAASTLFRIHRSVFGPLFYNRRSTSSTVFRFDASNFVKPPYNRKNGGKPALRKNE
jgi:hypothetical protein